MGIRDTIDPNKLPDPPPKETGGDFLIEIRDRETGEVVAVEDPKDVCAPKQPNDACGGCYDCMHLQIDWTKFFETRIPRPGRIGPNVELAIVKNRAQRTSLAQLRARFSKKAKDDTKAFDAPKLPNATFDGMEFPIADPFSKASLERQQAYEAQRQKMRETLLKTFIPEYRADPIPLPRCIDCGGEPRDCPECREKDGRCRDCGRAFETPPSVRARTASGACKWCEDRKAIRR